MTAPGDLKITHTSNVVRSPAFLLALQLHVELEAIAERPHAE